MQRNYKLPLDFDVLTKAHNEHSTCSLKQSIGQNINLIITTKYKGHRFDEDYGCEMWDRDFERILHENAWKERIARSVVASVKKYEVRLEKVDVIIDIADEEFVNRNSSSKGIRKKVTMALTGTIKETGEFFSFNNRLYLAPISFD